MGVNLLEVTAYDAHLALDEYARLHPDLIGSQWYHAATDKQLDLFYADWKRWRCKQRQLLMGG